MALVPLALGKRSRGPQILATGGCWASLVAGSLSAAPAELGPHRPLQARPRARWAALPGARERERQP
eukprot:4784098-Pyramimonas_sp.AAC.1